MKDSGSLAVNIFMDNVFVPLPRIRGIIRDIVHRNVSVVISRQWAEEQVLLEMHTFPYFRKKHAADGKPCKYARLRNWYTYGLKFTFAIDETVIVQPCCE